MAHGVVCTRPRITIPAWRRTLRACGPSSAAQRVQGQRADAVELQACDIIWRVQRTPDADGRPAGAAGSRRVPRGVSSSALSKEVSGDRMAEDDRGAFHSLFQKFLEAQVGGRGGVLDSVEP